MNMNRGIDSDVGYQVSFMIFEDSIKTIFLSETNGLAVILLNF